MRKIICLAFLFPQLVFGDSSFEKLDAYIEEIRLQKNVPGVAVAIVREKETLFSKGYGICGLDSPEKVDEQTIFQLASVSKTFTSAGLAVEVDKKKLRWDDEIIKHMPEFVLKDPYPTRFATSRDLLAHRTGLPAFGGDLLFHLGYSFREVLARIQFIEPGASFRNKALYSNVGFFAAGELLAKLAGKNFQDTIKDSLLTPLRMTRSGFSEKLKQPNVASAHGVLDGAIHIIPRDESIIAAAAGGITSCAEDMTHWMIMQLNDGNFEGKQIIQKETLKEMHLPSMVSEVSFTEMPPINERSGFSYGLGWNNYHYRGEMIVEKAGALDGVRTIVTLIPSKKAGIVVLANLNLTPLPEMIRAKFLEILFGIEGEHPIDQEITKTEAVIASFFQIPSKPEKYIPPVRSLEEYAGNFENELYGNFEVISTKGELRVLAGSSKWQGTLTHWSNETFVLTWPTINMGYQFVTFTLGPEGTPLLMMTESLGEFKRKNP